METTPLKKDVILVTLDDEAKKQVRRINQDLPDGKCLEIIGDIYSHAIEENRDFELFKVSDSESFKRELENFQEGMHILTSYFDASSQKKAMLSDDDLNRATRVTLVLIDLERRYHFQDEGIFPDHLPHPGDALIEGLRPPNIVLAEEERQHDAVSDHFWPKINKAFLEMYNVKQRRDLLRQRGSSV